MANPCNPIAHLSGSMNDKVAPLRNQSLKLGQPSQGSWHIMNVRFVRTRRIQAWALEKGS